MFKAHRKVCAKELLNDLNLEKLVLWYHDLYKRYVNEQNEKGSYARFLSDLSEWYGKKLYLKKEDEREDHQPEWAIVIDAPFSEEAVKGAIEKWLKEREYNFTVRLITLDQAKGSGLLKELRNRVKEIGREDTIP